MVSTTNKVKSVTTFMLIFDIWTFLSWLLSKGLDRLALATLYNFDRAADGEPSTRSGDSSCPAQACGHEVHE